MIRSHRDEIVDGSVSGGTNTSHTIVVDALRTLLDAVPAGGQSEDYRYAVVDENVLGKKSDGARARTFRYLRELYLLRPDSLLFRALRDLWPDDVESQPLIAGLSALARDSVFRASAPAVLEAEPGQLLTSTDLAAGVAAHFPESYGQGTLAKIGRNTFSSWEQTGHLAPAEHNTKRRIQPEVRPSGLAFAFLLGYLEGSRGEMLFETPWTGFLELDEATKWTLAEAASARGLIDLRQSGGMTDVSFSFLLRHFGENQ